MRYAAMPDGVGVARPRRARRGRRRRCPARAIVRSPRMRRASRHVERRAPARPAVSPSDVAAQPQPRPAGAAVRARRLGLQPVQQAAAELARGGARGAAASSSGTAEHGAAPVVDLRPVDERDVARVGAVREVAPRRDAAEEPELAVERRVAEVRADRAPGSPGRVRRAACAAPARSVRGSGARRVSCPSGQPGGRRARQSA